MPDSSLLRLEGALGGAWRRLHDAQLAADELGFETARMAIADMVWQLTEIQCDCLSHRKAKWRPIPYPNPIDFSRPQADWPDPPF